MVGQTLRPVRMISAMIGKRAVCICVQFRNWFCMVVRFYNFLATINLCLLTFLLHFFYEKRIVHVLFIFLTFFLYPSECIFSNKAIL